jgi:zinc protease
LQGGENDPDQLLDQELTATAFRAHPYGHPTIGWLSDLQTMTRDDLYGYYRRYYVPNNATLVIVGDVDRDDVLQARGSPLRRHSAS